MGGARLSLIAAGIAQVMAIWVTSAPAIAYCSEPTLSRYTPTPPWNEPDPPSCLADFKWSGKHTCETYEIDSYVDEINDYIRELNTYVEEANQVAKKAITYANEASSFAKCKADEAKEALE